MQYLNSIPKALHICIYVGRCSCRYVFSKDFPRFLHRWTIPFSIIILSCIPPGLFSTLSSSTKNSPSQSQLSPLVIYTEKYIRILLTLTPFILNTLIIRLLLLLLLLLLFLITKDPNMQISNCKYTHGVRVTDTQTNEPKHNWNKDVHLLITKRVSQQGNTIFP